MTTAPVLAVLVCHNGEQWLPDALASLREVTPIPRYRLAVDTGSSDGTAALLAAAREECLLDGVLTLPASTGFGEAVHAAVDHAVRRWGDPGRWLWLLHDDCAPEPGCLAAMLSAADASPSAALLGPLCLDWADPRLVVEAGLSTDASGHRQTGLATGEPDPSLLGGDLAQSTEVLAVSSAGALVARQVWEQLGGYDRALPMLRDDLDFGWRVNRAGHLAMVVPTARIRHARAAGSRPAGALTVPRRHADRAHGLRTFLVNCSSPSFVLGVPRLVALSLLRAFGFGLLRRTGAARAELYAVGYLVSGRAELRSARRRRRAAVSGTAGSVRGLLVGRWSRLRNAVRGGLLDLVRRRVAADAAIGRLPEQGTSWVAPAPADVSRPVGPEALPAGALGSRARHPRGGRPGRGRPSAPRVAGLRRPNAPGVAGLRSPGRGITVVVPRPAEPDVDAERPRRRPSPVPRGAGDAGAAEPTEPADRQRAGTSTAPAPARAAPELMVIEVGRGRLARELLLSPAVLLTVALVVVALVVHRSWLALDLSGGRLAPLPGLADIWSAYLAEWHPVAGGTASPAPATLAVVGVLGALGVPFGGPAAAVSVLLIGSVPLAGLSAYLASRRIGVPRWGRALAAGCYALLPVGVQAAVQGRLDGVIAHILLPAVLSGVVGVLSGRTVGRGGPRGWLPSACATALGLAVISAFAPLVHLIVLAVVLIGFVLVPGSPAHALRRIIALFVVVMLPLGLLLPWPAVVLQHPEVLLHGAGVVIAEPIVPPARFAMLDAGGAGSIGWLGVLVAAGAVLAVLARPRFAAAPGLAVAVIGLAAAVTVNKVSMVPLTGGAARPGWPGPALLVMACGLLWAALGAHAAGARSAGWRAPAAARRGVPVLAGLAALVVAALAVGALLTTGGALSRERVRLAAPTQDEVATDRTSVLVIGADARDPVRSAVGRLPAFGDDDLAPVQTVPARVTRWATAFRSGDLDTRRSAVLEAAVSGVEFVVLPDAAVADQLTGDSNLVTGAPPTSDGRPVVRLLPALKPVVVLPAQLADRARTGGAPPEDYPAQGVVPVAGAPPAVGAEVGMGNGSRVLVLAAEEEPGWLATVNGRRADVSRAWGHLVAVVLPPEAAEVRLQRSTAVRTLLLLVQLAVALFTVITAMPARPVRE